MSLIEVVYEFSEIIWFILNNKARFYNLLFSGGLGGLRWVVGFFCFCLVGWVFYFYLIRPNKANQLLGRKNKQDRGN